jgi:hypothetical protein
LEKGQIDGAFRDCDDLLYFVLPIDNPIKGDTAKRKRNVPVSNLLLLLSKSFVRKHYNVNIISRARARKYFPFLISDSLVSKEVEEKTDRGSCITQLERSTACKAAFVLVTRKGADAPPDLVHLDSDIEEDDKNEDDSFEASGCDSDGDDESESHTHSDVESKCGDEDGLVSSQRQDSTLNSTFITKNYKYYIQLFSDTDLFCKIGVSQVDDEKIGIQYTRDRIPFSSIIMQLPHYGPGFKELYDLVLKHSIEQYLFDNNVDETVNASVYLLKIVDGVMKEASSREHVTVLEPAAYRKERHELYHKKHLKQITKQIYKIMDLNMNDLKCAARDIEEIKNVDWSRSRFITRKINSSFPWWPDLSSIYASGF